MVIHRFAASFFQQVVTSLQMTKSLILTDFLQLDKIDQFVQKANHIG